MSKKLFYPALSLALLTGAVGAQGSAVVVNTSATAQLTTTQPEAQTEVTTRLISLPFVVTEAQLTQAGGHHLVIAQPLPRGLSLVAGSSRLDGQPVDAPTMGNGVLYWTLPAQAKGLLTFEVKEVKGSVAELPRAALAWATEQGNLSAIQGQVSSTDYLLARHAPTTTQNAGAIKLPLSGTEFRTTDQTTILVEGPLNETLDVRVNGQRIPEERIGTITKDPANSVQRLEFFGVSLQAGHNVITLGKDSVEVFVAGTLSRLVLEPIQTVADGSTPVRVRVRALDENGRGIAASYLTLSSNLDPLSPDAEPAVSGYQLRLQDGEGILELRPLTTPQRLELEILSGERTWRESVDITADTRKVGVGVVSATLGLNTQPLEGASLTARGYYEGPVGDGKLYVAADKDGLPKTPGTTENNERFGIYGDKSVETVPLRASGPVAALYEHPDFRAAYRYDALPSDVLPLGNNLTAATIQTKANPEISAFVAAVPKTAITDQPLELDGTRLLRLPHTDVVAGSLGLTLITVDGLTGNELRRRSLQEGTEWVLDPVSGVVRLVRPLDSVDSELNRQYVTASYRLAEANTEYRVAAGAQVVQRGETTLLGREGQYSAGVGAAYVDEQITFGVRSTYRDALLTGDARVLVSDGVLGEVNVQSRRDSFTLAQTALGQNNSFNVRYQSEGYSGLGKGQDGLNARGRVEYPVSEQFGVALVGDYTSRKTTSQGYVEALGLYNLQPWTFGAGARYSFGDRSGLGVTGSVAYRDARLSSELKHSQPVTGNALPETELGVTYRVAENVTLVARDRYRWGEDGGHLGSVALRNQVGNTNLEVGYEAGEQSSRARLGAGTRWSLNDRTTFGVNGSYVHHFGTDENVFTLSNDLRYQGEGYQASAGADLKYSDLTGGSTVLRGAVMGELSPELTVNADATGEFGARQGLKAGVGYAYRTAPLSSLGYLRYASGSLAGSNPQATAGIAAEYRAEPFRVRGGIDARLLLANTESLTYQPYLGLQYSPQGSRWMVGGWGRALIQPSSNTTLFGYGVEGGYEVLNNTWVNVGYNFAGFDGLAVPSAAGLYTRPGAYLRLDLTLDETMKTNRSTTTTNRGEE